MRENRVDLDPQGFHGPGGFRGAEALSEEVSAHRGESFGLLGAVIRPRVTSRRGLRRYVAHASFLSVVAALAVDVPQQLVFFVDWDAAIRSWALTVLVALGIAVPILHWIGRAKLELFEAKQSLETLSRTDSLTGLPNRRALLENAERPGVTMMALAILDLDHFKRINDTHGHRVGDAVLRGLAPILRAELEPCGMVGRLGGEEFALVARVHDPAVLLDHLDRLRRRLAAQPVVALGVVESVSYETVRQVLQQTGASRG